MTPTPESRLLALAETKDSLGFGRAENARLMPIIRELLKDRAALIHAVEHTKDFCLCSRNTVGFDYAESHPRKGKPKAGARWLTPRDVAQLGHVKSNARLTELCEKLEGCQTCRGAGVIGSPRKAAGGLN